MGNKIAFMGVGAVGGYAGAHMVQAGEDVTFIDPWPEHVVRMQSHGLKISHIRDVPEFTVKVRAMHLTDAQHLAKEKPIDIAFVCMKSYDTEWATTLISQYLSPNGFIVSLQNCMNEETIAGVVGWGRTRRLHRQFHHCRSVRARPCTPRGRQERREAHRVPHRRGAWPRHRPGEGDLPPGRPRRFRDGHREPLGRALVEAGDQRHGQRAVRVHRHDQQGHGPQRHDPQLLRPPRQRGDPRRPGARL